MGWDEEHLNGIAAAMRNACEAVKFSLNCSKWDDVVWKYHIHKSTAH